jgi:WD40 repeat protein
MEKKKLVLTGCKDGSGRVFDAETGQVKALLTGHSEYLVDFGFHGTNDSILASSSYD